jgi:GNAT superfamily N-acetyltransferase
MPHAIRPCRVEDRPAMLAIINAAAEAYRGAIPADCWHEPYMKAAELDEEIARGVAFTGIEAGDALAGIMGVQPVRNATLIRHAYVLPALQGRGLGGILLRRLCDRTAGQILIGTWAAASWAIGFYERHGFRLAEDAAKDALLATYWTIPARQAEVSVVLAAPPLDAPGAARLIAEGRGAPLSA